MTLEILSHHIGSSPRTSWEGLRPVRILSVSVALDLIFLIPSQAQWKWTLGTSDWRVNTSSSLELLECFGLLQGQSKHFVGSSPSQSLTSLSSSLRWLSLLFSSSFANSWISSLCILGAKHRVQGRLVYVQSQDSIQFKYKLAQPDGLCSHGWPSIDLEIVCDESNKQSKTQWARTEAKYGKSTKLFRMLLVNKYRKSTTKFIFVHAQLLIHHP